MRIQKRIMIFIGVQFDTSKYPDTTPSYIEGGVVHVYCSKRIHLNSLFISILYGLRKVHV